MNQVVAARPGFFRSIFGGLWWGINMLRSIIGTLIFLVILFFVFGSLFSGCGAGLKDKTTLILKIKGAVVEQYSGSDSPLSAFDDPSDNQTQLRDIKTALNAAAKDPKIVRVLIAPGEMQSAGASTLREIGSAIDEFKKSGKEVIAYSMSYDQRMLMVAAHANKVYLHPEGLALIEGLGRFRTYYRSALDKLGIDFHIFRVGEYKSAVEPYLLDGPSDAAKESDAFWIGNVWQSYLTDFAKLRGTTPAAISASIDNLPADMNSVSGNAAQLAVKNKFVDGLKTPDEIRAMMIAGGAADRNNDEGFRAVSLQDYVKKVHASELAINTSKIGIVVAEGGIVDGEAEPGEIGGDSTAALIRKAREDDSIKALVLRVNSPGGSGFASEIIRREIELTKKAGKPIVVSMGDLAASGGYWISMTSDVIYAQPTTITGSIGIFGMFPSAARGLDKIGVHSGGTSTTWLAGAMDVSRPLDPRLGDTIQTLINHGYQNFIGKVAQNRGRKPEEIDAIGRGRVWSGQQGLERGIVDKLGGLDDAIADAAKRAKLSSFDTIYVEKEPSAFTQLMRSFNVQLKTNLSVKWLGLDHSLLQFFAASQSPIAEPLRMFERAKENPLQTYAYCFCELK
jgi:protease IV